MHDPQRFAVDLSAKLASRSRHVCLFLGAGAAKSCGLPGIAELQTLVLADLNPADRDLFSQQLNGRNLEQGLSRLRRIAALETETVIEGLRGARANELDKIICQAIVKKLDIGQADIEPVLKLASWIARADYHHPIEIFTVNYDLLIETALDSLRVPYFDGFVGVLKAKFSTEMVENSSGADPKSVPAFFVRLWKLHGSVNWELCEDKQIVRLGRPVSTGQVAAIYPSDTKYEESRRVPFVVLQDRFRRAINQSETMVLITGYSFNDSHLNEMLFDAAARRPRSEFVALCYSDIPPIVIDRALSTPNLQVASPKEAILSGIRGSWKPKDDVASSIWSNNTFSLCDFSKLSGHLGLSTGREEPVIMATPEASTIIAG